MRQVPEIRGPMEDQEFHDSSLLDFQVAPQLNQVRIIVSTPDEHDVQQLWMITFYGVLRLEFETVGDGQSAAHAAPVEVYDIYDDVGSKEQRRWAERLRDLDVLDNDARKVRHIVLASSFMRGWGRNENMEGIQIICRDVRVEPAPRDYDGYQYRRPWIEADEE